MSEHHFYINSIDRENKSSTTPANFKVNLFKEINPCYAELSYALIPNTYYNITTNNNKFGINATTYTIPTGCYNLNDLLSEIVNLAAINIVYDDVKNKITISSNVNFLLDLNLNNSVAELLGFLNEVYENQSSYTAEMHPKIYNLALFIETNLGAGIITSCDNLKNTTFVIPANVNKSEIIQFYSKTQFSINPKIRQNGINFLEIKVRDEKGNIVEGLSDWSFMVKIK